MVQDASSTFRRKSVGRFTSTEKATTKVRDLSASSKQYLERIANEMFESGKEEVDINGPPIFDSNK